MKIGVLTYNNAINFGANLQAFSTYNYLQNHGYDPVLINYNPSDLKHSYSSFPKEQIEVHKLFCGQMYTTRLCTGSEDVAKVLDEENINNIIIGSDAVAQHHPLLSRIVFPSKKVFSIAQVTSDRMFPNPFWGEFLKFRPNTNVCLMSVSSQQADFKLFKAETRNEMMKLLTRISFISVRDLWTKDMYKFISGGSLNPNVTPDPVFAFNENCKDFIPSKEEILKKFNLPDKYILLSIRKGKSVDSSWSKEFEKACKNSGYACVGLPFPYGFTTLNSVSRKINLPISPMDWYCIIKYSSGYVGHNMHTIVSALHNSVPCYSLDQYGRRTLMQFCNNSSSKIFDILSNAGFADFRAVSGTVINIIPSAEKVVEKLLTFDREKCRTFASDFYQQYEMMMLNIEKTFV